MFMNDTWRARIQEERDYFIAYLVLGLTSETSIHNLNSANSACVALYVPTPHGDAVPFLK